MEAMYLDLSQTELVVLSACESGSGKVKHGEGVYGLQRAFLHAGSNHIIMSLWKVLDQPTMEFMEKFYNGLAISNDIAQSFREAQLYLKQKYPNPYIWAGFVLVEG
jgi:CHAT domain-containing protein